MSDRQDTGQDNATYQRLKATIKQTYPRGWFVGFADGQSVGAAATFAELERMLRSLGKDPSRILVVEAGVDYPDHVTILVDAPQP
jgi:hypothetical protein